MSRDYKDINKQVKKVNRGISPFISSLLSFVAGLSIGLFVAAILFVRPDLLQKYSLTVLLGNEQNPATSQNQAQPQTKAKAEPSVPIPKFEFYDILRKRKLNISETVASEQEARNSATDTAGVYVLQIGSYSDFQAADRLKARLALLGMTSYITQVVINGKDTIHRVRLGPFEDPAKLRETRRRLEENSLEYTLLKLELNDTQ